MHSLIHSLHATYMSNFNQEIEDCTIQYNFTMESGLLNVVKNKENYCLIKTVFYILAALPVKSCLLFLILQIKFHLKCITWDCSKKGRKPLPITQTGTCGKITHL